MTAASVCAFVCGPRRWEARQSWSRSPAQEPGAVVRKFRLAWWIDRPSASQGPGERRSRRPTSLAGMVEPDPPSASRARTSTEQGAAAPSSRREGQGQCGCDPAAPCSSSPLSETLEAGMACEAEGVFVSACLIPGVGRCGYDGRDGPTSACRCNLTRDSPIAAHTGRKIRSAVWAAAVAGPETGGNLRTFRDTGR
jgi:hypothetical protein